MRERLTLTTRDQQRLEVLTRWIARLLTVDEAAGLLGLSERSAWLWRRRLLKEGADGLVHGNRGRASPRHGIDPPRHMLGSSSAGRSGRPISRRQRLPSRRVRSQPRKGSTSVVCRFSGCFARPATPHLELVGHPAIGAAASGWPRQACSSSSMAHLTIGSKTCGPRLTLVGGIDDATGTIVGATFRDNEDGTGYLEVLRHLGTSHGLPSAVYRDRSGIFSPTHPRTLRHARSRLRSGGPSPSSGSSQSPPRAPRPKGVSSGSGEPARIDW